LSLQPPAANPPDSRWVLTDGEGVVLDASDAGAQLLGLSRRGLVGHSLYPFFQENRTAIRRFADRASAGMMVTMRGRVRPRDRKPVEVFAEIHPKPEAGRPELVWIFHDSPAD
jgi:PAS domain S-box-containing protein